jgi:hypothetical protein
MVWWYGNEDYYGYKIIIEQIRKNSENICIIGGLDYSYQWNFLTHYPTIYKEILNAKNLVLSIHPYGYKGGPQIDGISTLQIPFEIEYPKNNFLGDCTLGFSKPMIPKNKYGWKESFGFLFDKIPIIATEFGLDKDDNCLQGGWYMIDILEYFHNNSIGYVAWAWVQSRLSYPSLLDANFQPTGYALESPHGPACGVIENNFYQGPGILVFNDLTMNFTSRNLQLIENLETSIYLYIFVLIFFGIFIYLIYLIDNFKIKYGQCIELNITTHREKKQNITNSLRNRSMSSKVNLCIRE